MPPPMPAQVNSAPTTMPTASVGIRTCSVSAWAWEMTPRCPPDSQTTMKGSTVTRKITRDICTTATLAASAPRLMETETM